MARLAPRADVIHGHAIYYPSFDGAIVAALRYSIPLILSPYYYRRQGKPWSAYFRAILALAHRARPLYVAVSEYERGQLLGSRHVPKGTRVEVIRPLVQAPPGPLRNLEQRSAPAACFVGRISRDKGVFDLPLILGACRSKGLDVHLTVAGPDDGALPALRDAFAARQLTSSVSIRGPISEHDKAAIYAGSDYLFLPSSYEAYGMVLAEAAAAGCTPVAYATGAVPEVLENGKVGRLVDPGDITGFAQAVVGLADRSPGAAACARRSAAEHVGATLGFARWAGQWASVYGAECR